MRNETVLIYLERCSKYLFLYRNKKEHDYNLNKYIGIGGHVEENETIENALIREVKEETNLDLINYKKMGIVHFHLDDFYEKMHVFLSDSFKGELKECDEGELIWVDKKDIYKLDLWEGDKYFLDKLLKNEANFEISLYYKNDKLERVIEHV